MPTIKSIEVLPIAAPPTGFGGDARNIAQGGPAYANAVLEIITDDPKLRGTSLIFTNGHGLKEMCEVTRDVATRFLLDGQAPVDLDNLHRNGNLGKFCRMLLQDSDYAWLGGVGVSRMAIGAVANALWDLAAKMQRVPGWQFIVDLPPRELVEFIDFEQIGDVVPPAEALAIFEAAQDGKRERIEKIYSQGLLAYNTAGWSGISNEQLIERTRKMIGAGWPQIKIKVGVAWSKGRIEAERQGKVLSRKEIDDMALHAAEDDAERLLLVYHTIHKEDARKPKMKVAIDSNQVFDPRSAFLFAERLARRLYEANPEFRIDWFEEPTSQHSASGHVYLQRELNQAFRDYAPPLHVPISTGEHGASPVTFKDLLHAAVFDGSGMRYAIDVIQMDYSRVGGIGLCEGARNIQAIKEALFGSANNAGVEDILEFVAEETRSVHEGVFENPAIVKNGYYRMPKTPGVGVDYTAEGKRQYLLPDGAAWQATPELAEMARKFMLTSKRYV